MPRVIIELVDENSGSDIDLSQLMDEAMELNEREAQRLTALSRCYMVSSGKSGVSQSKF